MAAVHVALLPTCVVDTVAPQVGEAVVRVLRKAGHTVTVPTATTCCGQPAWNAGYTAEAARVAATTLRALAAAGADAICVPAGSCATMMTVFWPELFHLVGDEASAQVARQLAPTVMEFSALLAQGPLPEGNYVADVAYHHSCHMLRELHLRTPPLDTLGRLEGCHVVAWDGDDRCCGFGGLFSVKQPEISVAMADDKLDSLAQTSATELVGCDMSCLLHLGGRLSHREGPHASTHVKVRHLAQLLDEGTAP